MSVRNSDEASATRRGSNGFVLFAIVLSVATVSWLFVSGGLLSTFLSTELTTDEKLAQISEFIVAFGAMAPIAYVIIVAGEVVIAPIPGTMLYAPGGIAFGGFWGGLLSLVGNVIGAAVACQLTRVYGSRIGRRLFHKCSIHAIEDRVVQHGVLVIFILRVNPLTSSDLVSYAAGLTPTPVWKLCAGTALGMAPLCWGQAYLAEGLLSAFPQLLYPLAVLCVAYAIIAAVATWRVLGTAPTQALGEQKGDADRARH